jgi:D-apiose dehydrogenase
MDKLRVGIVGCGFFAQFHIDGWRRMEGVDLVAAADPDLARAGAAAPKAYATMGAMLDAEKLDLVDIATRPETHLALVKEALGRGVPAICQKPMAPTWAESREMAAVAERSGVPFMVHENWRWHPWYREAHRLIQSGAIGRPITYCFRARKRDGLGETPYTDQPYFRQMPRLLIYETLIHPIDTARLLFGDVSHVYADTRRLNERIVGEDLAYLLLSHESGLLGSIDGNRYTEGGYYEPKPGSPPLGEATFEGEEALLTLTTEGHLLRNGVSIWQNTVHTGYRGDCVLATQRHFVDHLRNGTPLETGASEYLKSVAIVEAAYESARRGARVALAEMFHA